MPQNTNFNVFPYFDDFDPTDGYHKVLFKPGYPVQARELTSLQSILQNQIEKFGNHVFKEGSVVIPGRVSVNNDYVGIVLEKNYLGLSVENYTKYLIGKNIVGKKSGVEARIEDVDTSEKNLVYVSYRTSSPENIKLFVEGETILLQEEVPITETGITTLKNGQGIGVVQEVTNGSAVTVSDGVFFLKGHFVQVSQQNYVISSRYNIPTGFIGFDVQEEVITAEDSSGLFDNAQGFENFAAPGADRFRIKATLSFIDDGLTPPESFVPLMRISNGEIVSNNVQNPQYNILANEFARRTSEESGDYYVNPINIEVKESINDLKGNGGVFVRLNGFNSIPAGDSQGLYKISSGKAYVKGFESELPSSTFVEFKKPRETKSFEGQSINYFTGPSLTLNRVYGCPTIGFSTSYTVSLRDQRVGSDSTVSTGNEIGIARVYDIALESGSYDSEFPNSNQWDISLYDVRLYTKIVLNENISLSVPTFIKGKASGATGFLRSAVSNSNILSVYDISGKFIFGEELLFDGIDKNRVVTQITEYGIKDVKSLYSNDAGKFFSADTVQYQESNIGQVNITPRDNATGVSTVTQPEYDFSKSFKIDSLVTFSIPNSSLKNISKVSEVSRNSLKIVGLTTVSGVYEGSLYTSNQTPTNFSLVSSKLQSSSDNTFYTPLPKRFISSVDLTDSYLTIRRVFNVSISSNSITIAPQELETNETFMPFDEERYILSRSDGTQEILTSDKFNILSGGKELVINGLGSNTSATLIATMRREKIKSKTKLRNRVKVVTIDKSKYPESGIGATTKNDGLLYGNYPYGTRVQDDEICLLVPDVMKIYDIFESNSLNDPILPSIGVQNVQSVNSSAFDIVIGEEIVGSESNTVAIVVDHVSSTEISICYLNENRFTLGETVVCEESEIQFTLSGESSGDKVITSNYRLVDGRSQTSYNYSKIERLPNYQEPSKKISIVFEYASIPSTDTGDIVTVDSYNQFDYCDIPETLDGIKLSDVIDVRPRVSEYVVEENARSPFEFLGRSFVSTENQNTNILAPDENILLDYNIYLPRQDRIFLTKDSKIQVVYGVPSETPELPDPVQDALEVAQIYLPAYLCNINDAKISLIKHKRYQMKDIALLEQRINNLEYYTTLSLLESNTATLQIKDNAGIDRFKSGFFVDNFTSTSTQIKKDTPKNSIDVKNNELRPSSYTTQLDLTLGATSLTGIGGNKISGQDPRFATDLIGNNVRRSTTDPQSNQTADGMGVVTLEYQEIRYIEQLQATRVENVTPYMVTFYSGTIALNPASDIWVDQVRLQPNTIDGLIDGYTFTQTQDIKVSDIDPQQGWSPVLWDAWQTNWTGSTFVDNTTSESITTTIKGGANQTDGKQTTTTATTIRTTTKTGTSSRTGSASQVKFTPSNTYNLGDKILSVDVTPFMRSRNVEFTARRMKPYTALYASFENISVSAFIVPKLLEIEVLSGNFIVGETVIGGNKSSLVNNSPYIQFRVASPNHRSGPFNNPTDIFSRSPFTREEIPGSYTATSEIVNIDTASLSLQSETSFYGFVSVDMILVGQTSGCRARVKSLKLVTDQTGTVIGSFFIPNPNAATSPKFQSGNGLFELLDLSSTSVDLPGTTSTKAQATYLSTGNITPVQGTVISTRKVDVTIGKTSEIKSVTDASTAVVDVKTTVDIQNPQPVPVPFVPPVAPPVSPPVAPPVRPPTAPPQAPPVGPGSPPFRPPTAPPPTPPPFFPPPAAPPPTAPPPAPVIPPAPVCPPGPKPRDCKPYVVIRGLAKRYDSADEARSAAISQGFAMGSRRGWPGFEDVTQQIKKNNKGCEYCAETKRQTRHDPLAQSFDVPSNGCFVTSLDLYFQQKDTDDTHVWVELRPMKLGLPDETTYPMSHKVIYGKDINLSDDATVATRVNFDAPIYLEGGKEHCVVIGSASNKYTVFISRLGEPDVKTLNSPESAQIPVTSQPQLGSLFKSQNATTWTPSQYEDLTFNLYIAQFSPEGVVSFFNPDVPTSTLTKDSLIVQSNRIRVGLGTTISIPTTGINIIPGNTVFQEGSAAVGNYIGGAGICTGNLGLVNTGIGFTPFSGYYTFNDVQLVTVTGSGNNATANITIKDGVAIAATVTSGGNGYVIGDILSVDEIGDKNLGRNLKLSVSDIFGINEIILDQVQGTFQVGAGKTIKFVNSSGINSSFSYNTDVFVSSSPQIISDGLHIKVNHKNHGMHSLTNIVRLSDIESDFPPNILNEQLTTDSTTITLDDASGYEIFENRSVSIANPGYILIGSEIISYTSVSNNILSGIERGVDSTRSFTHDANTYVYKYELNGISLRRINKNHDLQDVTINPPEGKIGLDHYYIKIDLSTNGVNRSVDNGLIPALKFNESKSCGGSIIRATNNIQFEIMKPIIQTLVLPGTSLIPRARTVTATSVSGNETSFLDAGYESITLDSNNYFNAPRLIASQENAPTRLFNLPGNKSFEIEMTLKTTDANLSPVIDLDRVGAIFVSNRVNSVITDYINDSRSSSLIDDPSAFTYATKIIELELPANSLKTIVSAYVNQNSDIRAFFAVSNDVNNLENPVYYPFPGYTNRISSGEIIDISDNDGTPDKKVTKVDNYGFGSVDLVFKDYEFTIDNLSSFKYFTIKLIGTSTDQCFPPRFRDFRVVAFT